MKKLIYFLLFLAMGLLITITLSSTHVYALENEESEEQNETNIETNENEVTTEKDVQEIRESISAILDSIDELKEGNINWFEDQLINHLLSFLFGAGGTLFIILIYLKKTKLVNSDITKLITKGEKTDDALMKDLKIGVDLIKQQTTSLGIKEEQVNKLIESTNGLVKHFEEKASQLEEQLKQQKVQNNEILEIIKIAFLNNTDLVKNGYAEKIERLIEKYEK